MSQVIQSLELLKNLCSIHESCTACWLYDPEEKETACFLIKAKEDSLAGNIEAAQRYIRNEIGCIMPECPDCTFCEYGHIRYSGDTIPGEKGLMSKWKCIYDPKVGGGDGNDKR